MTVSRDRTCFGPNCAITTMVVLKSERLGSNILRGFEMQLVETMALTTAHTATKKALTQTHETVRAECKLPVNVPLYGGEQRQVELRCLVPPHHACSTVNSARHIDITYNLNIRAFIATGQQIALKLPVVVSSWPQWVHYRGALKYLLILLIALGSTRRKLLSMWLTFDMVDDVKLACVT